MDGRVSERRGADAGATVMVVTKWANPSLSAIEKRLKISHLRRCPRLCINDVFRIRLMLQNLGRLASEYFEPFCGWLIRIKGTLQSC